jgi:ribose 5-phosphate isomerase B
MRVAFGTDESTPLTEAVQARLQAWGHDVETVADPAPGPDAGRSVGDAVAMGRADMGVVCCWTGTGVAIAANKVPGVRAALCGDAETARGARRWNDANVLALSLRLISVAVAEELLEAFLTTGPEPSEAEMIAAVESSPAPSRR